MESGFESRQAVARARFEALLSEMEQMTAAERDLHAKTAASNARTRLAEDLNQGLRRLRNAPTVAESAALLVELAAPFGARSAVVAFRAAGDAEVIAARRMGALPLTFAPNAAAAFQAAIETGDPVVALGTAAEISDALAERLDRETEERVHLYPLTVRGAVHGVLFVSGVTEAAALELLANVAALRWETLIPAAPARRTDLVAIAAPGTPPSGGASEGMSGESAGQPKGWADLTADEQALHRKAQRFARVKIAELRLAHETALRRGFDKREIYSAVSAPIDQAREEFRREYLSKSPTMVDYLYLEMVRGLAGDDDRRLGAGFPGPLK
jgi:hypothetical protein